VGYFGQGELAIIAKLVAPDITEKEVEEFVRKNIRSIDAVTATRTMIAVPPEEKFKPIDENLIAEEKEDWGPWM